MFPRASTWPAPAVGTVALPGTETMRAPSPDGPADWDPSAPLIIRRSSALSMPMSEPPSSSPSGRRGDGADAAAGSIPAADAASDRSPM